MLRFLCVLVVVLAIGSAGFLTTPPIGADEQAPGIAQVQLSPEHIAAVNRPRRVVVNYDIIGSYSPWEEVLYGEQWEHRLKSSFTFQDMEGSQIDSIFWSFEEGNEAIFPSQTRPVWSKLQNWVEAGYDIPQILLEGTKQRGLEAFYSYRINGSEIGSEGWYLVPMKAAHPDWLIKAWPEVGGFWNFAVPGVREYKLSILREVAENYDFDGIDINFARVPMCLPSGHQWELREHMTQFMRSVRAMLLEVGQQRGRPFLLSAQIPENIEGCHFDGLDVETWVREQLVDIFVLGVRAFEVDIEAFRRLTAGTNIKLYPCLDAHHSSDGYKLNQEHPPLEVIRGVTTNWWRQGADGICTFNFYPAVPQSELRAGSVSPKTPGGTAMYMYLEAGSPETLKYKDKAFVVERRGGGHGFVMQMYAQSTPRLCYFNTNMFGQLPATLANDGKADTLLWARVGDDVNAEADQIEQLTVRVLLSDPAAEGLAEAARLQPATTSVRYKQQNLPPAQGIEQHIELRLNNILLPQATVEEGWLVFRADPNQFAVGKNLIGIRVTDRPPDVQAEILVEKLEVHVNYR